MTNNAVVQPSQSVARRADAPGGPDSVLPFERRHRMTAFLADEGAGCRSRMKSA
jgi:hypothetical protein